MNDVIVHRIKRSGKHNKSAILTYVDVCNFQSFSAVFRQ